MTLLANITRQQVITPQPEKETEENIEQMDCFNYSGPLNTNHHCHQQIWWQTSNNCIAMTSFEKLLGLKYFNSCKALVNPSTDFDPPLPFLQWEQSSERTAFGNISSPLSDGISQDISTAVHRTAATSVLQQLACTFMLFTGGVHDYLLKVAIDKYIGQCAQVTSDRNSNACSHFASSYFLRARSKALRCWVRSGRSRFKSFFSHATST